MVADMPPLLFAPHASSTTSTLTPSAAARGLHVRQLMVTLLDDSQAPMLLGVTGFVLLIGLVFLTARIWSRLRPVSTLKADDWTVLASTVCSPLIQASTLIDKPQVIAMANFILITHACTYGFGRRAEFVPEEDRKTALLMIFISHGLWNWGVVLVKVSVSLLLLRLQPTRTWKIFLNVVMAILVLNGVVQTVLHFIACRPFSAYWDPISALGVDGQIRCLNVEVLKANIIISSMIHVAVDLILAFLPAIFICKLRRPRSEKVLLAVLMGFGIFAALFAILRTVDLPQFTTSPDRFRAGVKVTLFATLEHQFALIAATIPTLKSFMQSMLLAIGNLFYTEEAETQVRGKLVDFGLLGASEDLASRPARSAKQAEISRPKPAKTSKQRHDLDSTLVSSSTSAGDVGLEVIGSKI